MAAIKRVAATARIIFVDFFIISVFGGGFLRNPQSLPTASLQKNTMRSHSSKLGFGYMVFFLRKEGDSNPRYGYPYDSLANCWFQPLTHPSPRRSANRQFRLKYAFLSKAAAKVLLFFELTKFFAKKMYILLKIKAQIA